MCGNVRKYHHESCKNNYKETYKYANRLLFRKKETPLPSGKNIVIANNFNTFFIEKIEMDYLKKLPCELENHLMVESACFEPVTFQYIQEVISDLASKSCELDPMHTNFLKSNIDAVTPIICHIVNKSMSEGIFPDDLKGGIVQPLLKKSGLDVNENKNFRLVSYLPFLGKVTEMLVCK